MRCVVVTSGRPPFTRRPARMRFTRMGTQRLRVVSLLVLVASATPMAQTDAPLARSIAREAVRAATTLSTSVVADGKPQAGRSNWSRVEQIEDDIVMSLRGSHMTLDGSPSGRRTIVRGTVSATGLMVINLTDPTIPSAVRKTLADVASTHPRYFTDGTRRGSVRLNKHVSVGRRHCIH